MLFLNDKACAYTCSLWRSSEGEEIVDATDEPAERTVEARLLALRKMARKEFGKKLLLRPALGERDGKPPSLIIYYTGLQRLLNYCHCELKMLHLCAYPRLFLLYKLKKQPLLIALRELPTLRRSHFFCNFERNFPNVELLKTALTRSN